MLVYMLLFLSVTVGITYRIQFQSYRQLHSQAEDAGFSPLVGANAIMNLPVGVAE